MQVVFFCAVKFGLEAFNSADVSQCFILHKGVRVMHTVLDFLLYATTMADCEFKYRLCQLASQFSSNRVDDNLF